MDSDETKKIGGVSRRNFLGGAAVIAAGTLAASALSGCADNAANTSKKQAAGVVEATKESAGQRGELVYAPDHRGYYYQQDNWHFVHMEGTAYERGYQHGYLLAEKIYEGLDRQRRFDLAINGIEWSYFCRHAREVWLPMLDDEWKSEIQGIVDGALAAGTPKFDLVDLLVYNAHEELADYWFPTVKKEYYEELSGQSVDAVGNSVDPDAGESCSAFIATGSYTKDGHMVAAHNTWQRLYNGRDVDVALDIVPAQGNHILMQSMAGYIHSQTDWYQTDKLLITETTMNGFEAYDATGMPECIRIRKAAQYANTLDEFCSIMLEANSGGYANTWLVGDVSTDEIMRFELGCKFHKVDKTSDGYFAGFNLALDPRIRNFECSDANITDIRTPSARRVRIPQLVEEHKGAIDLEMAKVILSDHYDIYKQEINPCVRTVCSHYWIDPAEVNTSRDPYLPHGAVDGKVGSSASTKAFEMYARFGSSCGMGFNAADYLAAHPQYAHFADYLADLPTAPWTVLKA